MSNGHHASQLLQTIIIQLRSDIGRQSPEEQQAIVVEALAAALLVVDSSLSLAWTVHALAGSSLRYELTPLSNLEISIEIAWSIAIALRDQPQIATAEPVFVRSQADESARWSLTETPVGRSTLVIPKDQDNQLKECDLVMKGGIASGIVYPRAVIDLAKTYRFRSIGGTSAGAIAAAAAAAAEYGRESGGFGKLETVLDWLTEGKHLFHLFQPSKEARSVYDTWMEIMRGAQDQPNETFQQKMQRKMLHFATIVPRHTASAFAQGSRWGSVIGVGLSAGVGLLLGALVCVLVYLLLSLVTWLVGSFTGSSTDGWSLLAAVLVSSLLLAGCARWLAGRLDHWWSAEWFSQWRSLVMRDAFDLPRNLTLIGIGMACVLSLVFWLLARASGHAVNGWERIGPALVFDAIGALLFSALFGVCGSLLGRRVGGYIWSSVRLGRDFISTLADPKQGFGICTGSREHGGTHDHKVLTYWLNETINTLAGKTADADPLTFQDLSSKKLKEQDVGIIFRMVTTNLSHSQPYVFPLAEDMFLFHEDDIERLFPPNVLTYMTCHVGKRECEFNLPPGFHFLPSNEALPIVFATRLSLSFPIVLSAVPLYSISEAACKNPKCTDGRYQLTKDDLQLNWFSDGGISSNFPIHMFDAWVPTRPTFGIRLTSKPEEKRGPANRSVSPGQMSANDAGWPDAVMNDVERVYLPRPREIVRPQWTGVDNPVAFIAAIFSTAQNYRDNTQSALASYRERIVQVSLAKNEGGLNLDMPEQVLEAMESYGADVATKLIDFGGKARFQEHQWVRLRVLMAHLEEEAKRTVEHFSVYYQCNHPAWSATTSAGLDELFSYIQNNYHELINAQITSQTGKDAWYASQDMDWCNEALNRTTILLTFMREWKKADLLACNTGWPPFFNNDNVPVPPSVLRVTPEL